MSAVQKPKEVKLLPGEALGMIESRCMVGMFEAADGMCLTANVVFVGWD
jgi:microcompartment protein CcmL/EutN